MIKAPSGAAALDVLKSDKPVDLMITDYAMPGMTGLQLAEAARLLRPDLPILFMTGYAENAAIAGGFLEPGMEMITKPFAISVFTSRVSEILNDGG